MSRVRQELRRIANHLAEVAHFGRAISGECPAVAVIPAWRMDQARAAWHLGARHDGRGELHGPSEALGDPDAAWGRRPA